MKTIYFYLIFRLKGRFFYSLSQMAKINFTTFADFLSQKSYICSVKTLIFNL